MDIEIKPKHVSTSLYADTKTGMYIARIQVTIVSFLLSLLIIIKTRQIYTPFIALVVYWARGGSPQVG